MNYAGFSLDSHNCKLFQLVYFNSGNDASTTLLVSILSFITDCTQFVRAFFKIVWKNVEMNFD